MNLAVLASGKGTNLQVLIDQVHSDQELGVKIAVVISDNKKAYALTRAKNAGIAAAVVDLKSFPDREAFDAELSRILDSYQVELIASAGFMRILGKKFIEKYRWRIMNIHPSLLPSFSGAHAERDALEHGVKVSGVTVHFSDEGIDTGPIILQAAVPVYDNDTVETLHARIQAQEHIIFPKAIRLFAEGKLKIVGRKVIIAE